MYYCVTLAALKCRGSAKNGGGGGHAPCAYDGDGALNYTAEYVDEVWSLAFQYGQKAVTVEYVIYAHDVI